MLALVGVDYKTAGIELREKIALTESKIKQLLIRMKDINTMKGVTLLSTCNRTELYLSYDRDISSLELKNFFCEALECFEDELKKHIYIKYENEVIVYLFELASGIHSMIFGDDQIASQIGEAIELANEVHASDAILNTLFRHAVTCAKKVRTSVTLKAVSPSVATQAAEILDEFIGEKKNRKALVIGNGEIGRSITKLLIAAGCEVTMTLRSYKYKQNLIPKGCHVIEYENRNELYPEVDILISATKSPHHTVSYEMIHKCSTKPKFILDLALPRDIDPKIGQFKELQYYDIDAIGKNARHDNTQEIILIHEIIEGQLKRFQEWLHYKMKNEIQMVEEYTG